MIFLQYGLMQRKLLHTNDWPLVHSRRRRRSFSDLVGWCLLSYTKHARIVFANSIRVKLFKSLCKVLSTTQNLIVYSSRPPSFNTVLVRRRALQWTFKAGVTDDCHFWLCSSTLLTRSWSLMHKSPRLARLPGPNPSESRSRLTNTKDLARRAAEQRGTKLKPLNINLHYN